MRLAALALPLLFVTAVLTFSPRVSAQTASDADRAAARELFNKGVELQNQQKFADALDHFERSQKVVNAPTIYLHVGQCQAALGHLVEAAEAFRQAVNFQLPPNPPAPFVAAQNEATTQLATITPRIPELKITVQPKDIPTLNVTVDDVPVNSALVGVSRPTNPGQHKVSASAPGYTKAEKMVDLKEKQKLEVTLSLVSTGGVVYGAGADTGVTVSPAASASAAPTDTSSPPKPPPPPADTRSKMSLFIGPRLGLSLMGGNLPTTSLIGSDTSIGDVAGPGGDIGIEGFFRFVRILYIGLSGDLAGYSGKDTTISDSTRTVTLNGTATMTTGMISGRFGLLTNPEGLGFMGDLGVGYRALNVKKTSTDSSLSSEASFGGFDYMVRVGAHFKAGKYVRIFPQAEIGYGNLSLSGASVTAAGAEQSITTGSDSSSHFTFFFGVGGYFDIELDKPKPKPDAAPTSSPTPSAPASSDASGSAGVTLSSPTSAPSAATPAK